jgi:hypothetical protein
MTPKIAEQLAQKISQINAELSILIGGDLATAEDCRRQLTLVDWLDQSLGELVTGLDASQAGVGELCFDLKVRYGVGFLKVVGADVVATYNGGSIKINCVFPVHPLTGAEKILTLWRVAVMDAYNKERDDYDARMGTLNKIFGLSFGHE